MRASGGDPVKRTIDLVGALAAITVFLPVIVLTAVVVLATMGRPVLFRQERVGHRGRVFSLVKFRTMVNPAGPTDAASDAHRLTAVGRSLRRSSLDELPTFWNVLRGEMSLVGPRPLPVTYLGRYTPRQARRHEVKPGLTGLAQVSGRNLLTWPEKFDLDVWYVEHRSTRLDLRLLVRTLRVVAGGHGVTAPDGGTAVEFLGSPVESERGSSVVRA